MIKDSQNKMQTEEKNKSTEPVLYDYFYPQYTLTIKAVSQEEADNQLREIIKNKKLDDHE